MAVIIIPTRSEVADFQVSVSLDSALYRLRFYYNDRDQSWYFDMSTNEESQICTGMKLVSNAPLLRRIVDAERPLGELIALNTVGDADAQLGDLGTTVKIAYVEVDTL